MARSPNDDSRSVDILREVRSRRYAEISFSSVNGIIGGLLGKLKTHNPELLYSHANLRLMFHEDVSESLQLDWSFQLYLRKFIEERISKEQAKALAGRAIKFQ